MLELAGDLLDHEHGVLDCIEYVPVLGCLPLPDDELQILLDLGADLLCLIPVFEYVLYEVDERVGVAVAVGARVLLHVRVWL